MSPEPQIQATPLPVATIDDIIFSEEFLQLQGPEAQRQHLLERATLDWETIQQVSHFTASWQMIRKRRLTASNFGSILNTKRVTPSLIKHLLGEYDLTRVKAVQWGITNEAEALNSFIQKTDLQVVETGVWLHECGVLGASPDGLVEDNSVVEAKCPYTQRNLTIEEAIATNNFCLEKRMERFHWNQTMSIGTKCKARCFLLNDQSVTLLYGQQRTLLYWKFSGMTLGR